ncbi:MAG TPA: superoxide dismutase family protein [Caulobacteraceae bacterium]|nr:superoxide dismutase family protein [Caulobacteraceae bacterium]
MNVRLGVLASFALVGATPVFGATLHADMAKATLSGAGAGIGTVTMSDSAKGDQVTVSLHGLTPGLHAFHVHQNPSCAPGPVNGKIVPAGAAGDHYGMTAGMSMGAGATPPLGDLPSLTVKADGTDNETLLAPRLTNVAELKGHAVIIHAGDATTARFACGLLK